MAVSPRNANRSTRLRLRSPRPPATTSAEPSRSNMLHHSPRPSAARHHHLQRQPQEREAKRQKSHPQTAINQLLELNLLAPRDLLQLPHPDQQHANRRDRLPTTLPLAQHLLLRPALQLAVRWALQDFLREETRMASLLSQQLLQPMPKVASPNPRANNTQSRRRSSLKLPFPARLASGYLAHSEDTRSSLVHPARVQRATSGRILLPRHLAA